MNKNGVIIMGLEGAGKTMLLNRMENKEYANY